MGEPRRDDSSPPRAPPAGPGDGRRVSRGRRRICRVASGRGCAGRPCGQRRPRLPLGIISGRLSPRWPTTRAWRHHSALLTGDRPVTEGKLTKAALVEEVAQVAGLSKKAAERIVETVFGSIAESLRGGEKVELRGFGSFRLRRRAPRRGRNPRSGERVEVPSKHVAYFTAGKELKASINGESAVPPPVAQ